MVNRQGMLIETLLPKDTNGYGNIFGGVIMSIMDKTAGVACWRYAQKRVVTACVEHIAFHTPIYVGEVVYSTATIIHVGRSSMTVEVEVEVEDVQKGTRHRGASGLFTMVAVDEEWKPSSVPPYTPETEVEKAKWQKIEDKRRRKSSK